MTELIDILDKNGKKTGVIKSREDAKKDNDIYRIVYLWIICDNKILLQQRSFNKKTNPGKWDCAVAGHVLAGEESVDAIIRETKEELGINISKNDIELIYSNIGFNKKYQFHDVYLLERNIDINSLELQKEEVECCKYATINEIEDLIKNNQFSEGFHNNDVINTIKIKMVK